ncbi:hypothetical protein AKO1_004125 [Acrasis kona]|uniref:Uncharacterized protein n=1 Tax=Acrasis kona TaxID=1008807 RepID=A0AAW2ZAL0_9EUKA
MTSSPVDSSDNTSCCPAHFVIKEECTCSKFGNKQFSKAKNQDILNIHNKIEGKNDMVQYLSLSMNIAHSVEELYSIIFKKYSEPVQSANNHINGTSTDEVGETIITSTPEAPFSILDFQTPAPPEKATDHLANLYTNKIHALHAVWILQANRRGILTYWETEQLLAVVYNGDFRCPIYQLMCTLYESLCCVDDTDAHNKWNPVGNMLLKELLSLIEKRSSS